jgi:hypothetical protein
LTDFLHGKPPARHGAGKEVQRRASSEKVLSPEQKECSGRHMLHELQVHRQILYDLAGKYLEPMSGFFERLLYLASLRDISSGCYVHDRLGPQYGDQPVTEALAKAHEEVFEGLLEIPLAQQEEDLRAFLKSGAGKDHQNLNYFETAFQNSIPAGAPVYLKNLFRSNLGALWALLQGGPTVVRSSK